jgi:hypothetical protein
MKTPAHSQLAVAAIAALVLLAGLIFDSRATLAAYLVGWIALGSIPLGALGILTMTYLVRRAWTPALHGILTYTTAAIPVVGLLFVPVLAGMVHLYPAAADRASLSPFKAFYLAPWVFALRTIVYFAIWSWLALWLRNASNDSERMTRAASAGLIICTLSVSLAGVDWVESLEPDFHSSVYGLLFLSFSLLNGLAFAVGSALLLRRRIGSLKGYSALLLSFILFWAYLHAMQYIVIWSGNIPAEVTWYLKRSSDGWQFAWIVVSLGQLVFPFLALLNERVRSDRRWLLALCGLTLVMRCCEAAVLILPAVPHIALSITAAMLLAALVFIGMVLWWTFELARRSGNDPINLSAWQVHAETGSK